MGFGAWVDSAVDRAYWTLAPRRAAVRSHLRRMDRDPEYRQHFGALMRAYGYRAARSGERGPKWLGGSTSADAEILNDLPALRNRSRELGRDDPVDSGLVKTFVHNIVGTGLRPQARTGDPSKNAVLEAYWKVRAPGLFGAESLSFGAGQRLLVQRWLEDGDVFLKAAADGGGPVWFEVVEAERVTTPTPYLNKVLEGESEVREGVERDRVGRRTWYWVLKRHPGDALGAAGRKFTLDDFTRVPADLVRHLRTVGRPGQTRGVPLCHALLQDMRDLDLLLLASLKRVQIAACLAVFIRSDLPLDDLMQVQAEKEGYVMDETLEPGMMMKLRSGDSIETVVPNFPTPELEPFIVMLARRIGAAVGVSWQTVLRDFSKSTYSSARTDLLETWRTYDVYAEELTGHLDWLWQLVMSDGLRRGALRGVTPADAGLVQWIAPGRKWVDPMKEAQAAQVELAMGTTTLRDICAAQGKDWEDIQTQRLLEEQREAEERKRLGLRSDDDVPGPEMMENLARAVRAGVPVAVSEARSRGLGLPPKAPGNDVLLRFNDQDILAYHIESGVLTINEIRARLKLAAVPWGDVPVRRANVQVVDPTRAESDTPDGDAADVDTADVDGEDDGEGAQGRAAGNGNGRTRERVQV